MRVQVLRPAPCSVSSAVEQRFCKAQVAGSIPCTELQFALLAHSAEHRFGRAEAAGAEPAESSTRSWWNGRHNGFRSRRRKTWEFESLRAHQSSSWRNGRRGGFKSRCPCGVQVRVLPGTPIRGRGGTAHAVGLTPASCRFESCRPHQFALPSPSGKGIWFTPRHSAVRVRQGAPLQRLLSPASAA